MATTTTGEKDSRLDLKVLLTTLIEDLVSPLNEVVRVINAVSTGDLSQNVPVEMDGKRLEGQFLKVRRDGQRQGRPPRHLCL